MHHLLFQFDQFLLLSWSYCVARRGEFEPCGSLMLLAFVIGGLLRQQSLVHHRYIVDVIADFHGEVDLFSLLLDLASLNLILRYICWEAR